MREPIYDKKHVLATVERGGDSYMVFFWEGKSAREGTVLWRFSTNDLNYKSSECQSKTDVGFTMLGTV
jgi:hypothetical protein